MPALGMAPATSADVATASRGDPDSSLARLKLCVERGESIQSAGDWFVLGNEWLPKDEPCECPWVVKDIDTREMVLEQTTLATLVLLVQSPPQWTWSQYMQASRKARVPALSLWSFKNAQLHACLPDDCTACRGTDVAHQRFFGLPNSSVSSPTVKTRSPGRGLGSSCSAPLERSAHADHESSAYGGSGCENRLLKPSREYSEDKASSGGSNENGGSCLCDEEGWSSPATAAVAGCCNPTSLGASKESALVSPVPPCNGNRMENPAHYSSPKSPTPRCFSKGVDGSTPLGRSQEVVSTTLKLKGNIEESGAGEGVSCLEWSTCEISAGEDTSRTGFSGVCVRARAEALAVAAGAAVQLATEGVAREFEVCSEGGAFTGGVDPRETNVYRGEESAKAVASAVFSSAAQQLREPAEAAGTPSVTVSSTPSSSPINARRLPSSAEHFNGYRPEGERVPARHVHLALPSAADGDTSLKELQQPKDVKLAVRERLGPGGPTTTRTSSGSATALTAADVAAIASRPVSVAALAQTFSGKSVEGGAASPLPPVVEALKRAGRAGDSWDEAALVRQGAMKIGSVVRTRVGQIGTVRYSGVTEFATGFWLGLELHECLGKNDGSNQGKRYFTCAAQHGLFVRPANVTLVSPAPSPVASEFEEPTAAASAPPECRDTGRLREQREHLAPDERLARGDYPVRQMPQSPGRTADARHINAALAREGEGSFGAPASRPRLPSERLQHTQTPESTPLAAGGGTTPSVGPPASNAHETSSKAFSVRATASNSCTPAMETPGLHASQRDAPVPAIPRRGDHLAPYDGGAPRTTRNTNVGAKEEGIIGSGFPKPMLRNGSEIRAPRGSLGTRCHSERGSAGEGALLRPLKSPRLARVKCGEVAVDAAADLGDAHTELDIQSVRLMSPSASPPKPRKLQTTPLSECISQAAKPKISAGQSATVPSTQCAVDECDTAENPPVFFAHSAQDAMGRDGSDSMSADAGGQVQKVETGAIKSGRVPVGVEPDSEANECLDNVDIDQEVASSGVWMISAEEPAAVGGIRAIISRIHHRRSTSADGVSDQSRADEEVATPCCESHAPCSTPSASARVPGCLRDLGCFSEGGVVKPKPSVHKGRAAADNEAIGSKALLALLVALGLAALLATAAGRIDLPAVGSALGEFSAGPNLHGTLRSAFLTAFAPVLASTSLGLRGTSNRQGTSSTRRAKPLSKAIALLHDGDAFDGVADRAGVCYPEALLPWDTIVDDELCQPLDDDENGTDALPFLGWDAAFLVTSEDPDHNGLSSLVDAETAHAALRKRLALAGYATVSSKHHPSGTRQLLPAVLPLSFPSQATSSNEASLPVPLLLPPSGLRRAADAVGHQPTTAKDRTYRDTIRFDDIVAQGLHATCPSSLLNETNGSGDSDDINDGNDSRDAEDSRPKRQVVPFSPGLLRYGRLSQIPTNNLEHLHTLPPAADEGESMNAPAAETDGDPLSDEERLPESNGVAKFSVKDVFPIPFAPMFGPPRYSARRMSEAAALSLRGHDLHITHVMDDGQAEDEVYDNLAATEDVPGVGKDVEDEAEAAAASHQAPAFMRPEAGLIPVTFLKGCGDSGGPVGENGCQSLPMLFGHVGKNELELREPGESGETVWRSRRTISKFVRSEIARWTRHLVGKEPSAPLAIAGFSRVEVLNETVKSANHTAGNEPPSEGMCDADVGRILLRDFAEGVCDMVEDKAAAGKRLDGRETEGERQEVETDVPHGDGGDHFDFGRYAVILAPNGVLCVLDAADKAHCMTRGVHRWHMHTTRTPSGSWAAPCSGHQPVEVVLEEGLGDDAVPPKYRCFG